MTVLLYICVITNLLLLLMKNLLLGLFILLAFTACKKNEDATPDAGATVAGTYQMTLLGVTQPSPVGYIEIPLPSTTPPFIGSGTLTAARTNESTIDLSAKITQTVSTSIITYTYNPISVTLQKNNNSYDMFNSGTKIGTADGANIAVDITVPASGTTPAGRVVFKGKK